MSKREVLIKALAATPGDLARLVRGMEHTAVKPGQENQLIRAAINHLNQVENQYQLWLQEVITETRPFISNHVTEMPPPDLLQMDALLGEFRQARQQTVNFLQEQNAGNWQRTAVHETNGPLTFRTLVQLLVDHDTEHLNQIVDFRRDMC